MCPERNGKRKLGKYICVLCFDQCGAAKGPVQDVIASMQKRNDVDTKI
jgi:hypothetical protein